MLTLSYEFQFKLTFHQAQAIESWLEIYRQVWHDGLREGKDGVKSQKSPVNTCSLVRQHPRLKHGGFMPPASGS
jgi:hypothetical protein